MKTIETGTQLMPLVRVGTYDGQTCDINNLVNSYEINQDFKEGYVPFDAEMYWDKGYDHNKFKQDIVNMATNYINQMFTEIKKLGLGIKKIVIQDLHSPRYYNFETDQLYFDLVVNNNFHKNLLKVINKLSKEQKDNLDKWLRDNFSSYDGFTSFTANNLGDLMSEIKAEEIRETSVFLYWYFLNCGSDDLQEYLNERNWSDYLYENKEFYTEYVRDGFYAECEANDSNAVKYTQENYLTKDKETIIAELTEQINESTDTFDNNELRIERMIKTVNNVFKTIESNTLDLFGK